MTGPGGFSKLLAAGGDTAWSVKDLALGEYTLTESTVPAGYTGAAPKTFTVDAGHLIVDLGAIVNTKVPVPPVTLKDMAPVPVPPAAVTV